MNKLHNQHALPVSKESLKFDDSRVSNIIQFSEDGDELIDDKNTHNTLKRTEESDLTEDNENSYKNNIYFSPSIPTKVNSSNNIFKSQKTFLVRNQEESSQNLTDIKIKIEDLVEKYSNTIEEEMKDLNNNYNNNYESKIM